MIPPLISICIPCYNSEKYIKETIESVLSQSYQNFEIIIVDDASVDNTLNLINSINDHRIKVFQNQNNVGPTETWNKLLKLAQGDYLKILCHDDILYPDNLKLHIEIFMKEKDVALTVSNRDIINCDGEIISSVERFKCRKKIIGKCFFIDAIKTGKNIIGEPHALLFDKKIIDKNNITFGDNFYLIDLEFYSKILMYGNAFTVNKTLSAFRVTKDSASFRMSNNQAEHYIKFVKNIELSGEYSFTFMQRTLIIIKAKVWQLMKTIYYYVYL